jgi:hypothetical protein
VMDVRSRPGRRDRAPGKSESVEKFYVGANGVASSG